MAPAAANDGFGNLYKRRPVEIVPRPKAGGEAVRISTKDDPRRWMIGRTTACGWMRACRAD